ncbi:beta-phosphoglucomutase family hydrolase [Vibrio cyclitrophicus]
MIRLLEKYQGIIFDLDGTLIDTMPHHLDTWRTTAEAFHFPYDRQWLHDLGGMPGEGIVDLINDRYNLNLDNVEVSEFRISVFNSLAERGDPISCTNEILNHFFGQKKLAVGTGSSRLSALEQLERTGIYPKLDSVVTANDVEKHKPNPDTFLLAANEMAIDPKLCVVFEDTALGKLAAHRAKMDCIMLEGEQLNFYPCSM